MEKFRSSCRLGLLVAAGSAVLIGIVLLVQAWKGVPFEQLTRDPNAIFDMPLYIGFLSQAGIFLWAAAAAICLFGGAVLASRPDHTATSRFLYAAGLLSMLLGLDDAFLLHEQFFPFIGIPEKAVYVMYACLTLFFLFRFRDQILDADYPLLAAALMLFAASILLDVIQPEGIDIFLIEDGAKLVGIMSWMTYFARAAYVLSTDVLPASRSRRAKSLVASAASGALSPEQMHA